MTDTEQVLTRHERLVAAAAGGVMLAGLVGTSFADVPGPAAAGKAWLSAQLTQQRAGPTAAVAAGTPAVAPTTSISAALPASAAPTPPLAGCPAPIRHPSSWTPRPLKPPSVADAALPAPLPRRPKASDLSAISGKGIWVTNWPHDNVDATALVSRAKSAGLTSIWVRSGGSIQGYYGERVLRALVPAAHGAGLKVVAWDFPLLSDPAADALRARKALDTGIDAFAPDVETTAEGTHATRRRVTLYLSLVRTYAGDRPVAATVPRPTPTRLSSFPYAAFAPYADVFVPMVYWSCNEPGLLVQQSLARLGHWLPVAPVGQAYDMRTDGGRAGLPNRAETWRFLDSARRGGAVGVSLWTIETIGSGQWSALRAYPWPGR
ncbi:MAG: hypothetical protein NVS3B26_13260 [Mycobacteriales bacterium]